MIYCECNIPSASSHHENCINDGCHKKIKTIHQEYDDLKKELTQERERRESAEKILKEYDENQEYYACELSGSWGDIRRESRDHFKKYDSHQSENKS